MKTTVFKCDNNSSINTVSIQQHEILANLSYQLTLDIVSNNLTTLYCYIIISVNLTLSSTLHQKCCKLVAKVTSYTCNTERVANQCSPTTKRQENSNFGQKNCSSFQEREKRKTKFCMVDPLVHQDTLELKFCRIWEVKSDFEQYASFIR